MTKVQSVLMFCPQFRPLVGGAERQAEKLSKALVRRGLRVTVLTPRLVEEASAHEDDCGVAIHRFPLFDLCKRMPGVRCLGPLNLMSLRWQTLKAVSRHLGEVDVLHAHIASVLSAFAIQAAHRAGVPAVCKMAAAGAQNDLTDLVAVGVGGARLARQMVDRLDCFIATTELACESLLARNVRPGAIAMIPNGVHLAKEQDEKRARGRVRRFLYMGRLSRNCGRDFPSLVRAFDRVADEAPDVELAIVGDGDLFHDTLSLIGQMRNRDRIRMPGYQPPQPWFEWADCLVLPSRREGLSNALLEAMAYGLPCIANDIPPNREVLDDGRSGLLVPVGDAEPLRRAMVQLASEPHLASALGKAALARVRMRYAIDAVADQHLQLYERLKTRRLEPSTHAQRVRR